MLMGCQSSTLFSLHLMRVFEVLNQFFHIKGIVGGIFPAIATVVGCCSVALNFATLRTFVMWRLLISTVLIFSRWKGQWRLIIMISYQLQTLLCLFSVGVYNSRHVVCILGNGGNYHFHWREIDIYYCRVTLLANPLLILQTIFLTNGFRNDVHWGITAVFKRLW